MSESGEPRGAGPPGEHGPTSEPTQPIVTEPTTPQPIVPRVAATPGSSTAGVSSSSPANSDQRADAGETAVNRATTPEADTKAPRKSRKTNWLPWAVIVAVVVVGLAIALPFTLGGSSSSASPTPTAASNSTGDGGASADLTGSFLTPSVVGARLMFLSLTKTGSDLSGHLAITAPGPAHKHLVTHTYDVTGNVTGNSLHLTVQPTDEASYAISGTYVNGSLELQLSNSVTVTLKRGTLVQYKSLVKLERKTLLAS